MFWNAAPAGGEGWLPLVLALSAASLVVALLFTSYVLKQDTGTAAMQEISNAIKEGAEAFLRRQYKTITMLTLALAVVILLGYWVGKGDWGSLISLISFRVPYWKVVLRPAESVISVRTRSTFICPSGETSFSAMDEFGLWSSLNVISFVFVSLIFSSFPWAPKEYVTPNFVVIS